MFDSDNLEPTQNQLVIVLLVGQMFHGLEYHQLLDNYNEVI